MVELCFPNERNTVASLMNAKQTFIKLVFLNSLVRAAALR